MRVLLTVAFALAQLVTVPSAGIGAPQQSMLSCICSDRRFAAHPTPHTDAKTASAFISLDSRWNNHPQKVFGEHSEVS
jgi:hypothetical protein